MHPIAENDRAWGRGFTEWTNVSKATPQFSGHYQPKLPGELGFYDLRQPEVMYRQIELAKLYGLYGFCFHYYWFNGLRLLERPLDMFLNDRSMDFKFCLCWANENWTRNWDGDHHEVLLAQQHSTKDHERIFEDLLKYMRDERYIRINGRPLIVIYRPDIISELEELVKIWRQKAMGVGLPGIYLAATNAFAFKSAGKFGFDAICEFPPHGLQVAPVDTTKSRLNADFSGVVHRYEDVVAKELQKLEALPSGDVPTFPGVMPAWDNEARRPGRGRVFHASTPASFQVWLTGAAWHVSRYFAAEQRFVFINAWNEWAEGAYLEPDRRFGYAYLAAVRNVVQTFNVGPEQLQKLVAGFDVQHCTTCGTAAERGAESKQRDRTGVIGAISQACSEPVSAGDRSCPLQFEQGTDFQNAATRLGYSRRVVREIARITAQHFADLRWDEPGEGDAKFLCNLVDLGIAFDTGKIRSRDTVSTVGPACDFLYPLGNRFHFTKALNFAAMACIQPSRPCALVASVRNEGPFLLEWLAYYRSIGLEDIYIYTNDNTDGSTELLEQLARHGIIKLILNSSSQNIDPLIKAYEHSLFLLPELRQFEWVFYLDADEFFVPDAKYDFNITNIISAVNSRYPGNLPSCICYNWHWIGSGGAVRRAPGFVTERFRSGAPDLQHWVKSLVRPSAVMSMGSLHAPDIGAAGFAVNSALEPVEIISSNSVSPSSSSGKIYHYWQKSFEEFLVKQARRSGATHRAAELFFRWDVPEKRKMLTSIPGHLREKLHREHEGLLSLPGIASLSSQVNELYSQLCQELTRGEEVELLYRREKLRACSVAS